MFLAPGGTNVKSHAREIADANRTLAVIAERAVEAFGPQPEAPAATKPGDMWIVSQPDTVDALRVEAVQPAVTLKPKRKLRIGRKQRVKRD